MSYSRRGKGGEKGREKEAAVRLAAIDAPPPRRRSVVVVCWDGRRRRGLSFSSAANNVVFCFNHRSIIIGTLI